MEVCLQWSSFGVDLDILGRLRKKAPGQITNQSSWRGLSRAGLAISKPSPPLQRNGANWSPSSRFPSGGSRSKPETGWIYGTPQVACTSISTCTLCDGTIPVYGVVPSSSSLGACPSSSIPLVQESPGEPD
ncbi:uncharacterized protein PV07_03549 [Cladophialophora immunda]|uniref:Uncharacterized protein n=1 Tax=Cladophialophora immunda TaxID=569365 RepID=A0A0D2CLC3_9EURO|nr:uncharacterized protein PV07_03549 [Cladophialophora immunda]KIW31963.1 hypothetical protein PV07_03549 [Cladophialophora immunda]